MPNLAQDAYLLAAAAFTDTGRVRKHNEDSVAYHVPPHPSEQDAYGALFVVCDGVGGGAAGEVASEHAVRRILNDYYQAPADQPPLSRLAAAIQQANLDIFQRNAEQADGRLMTTTVVAAVLLGHRLFLAHAGDSRAYLVRSGQITQLTRDHSWVAEMVRSGDLTPQEAEAHPWRNRITRALGMKEVVDPEAQTLDVMTGDRLVLCSDGLTRHVSDAEIATAVMQQGPHAAARQLIGLANQRGGSDNISVIVAELSARERSAPPAVEEPTQRPRPRPGPPNWLLAALIGLVLIVILALGGIYLGRNRLRTFQPTLAPTEPPRTPTLAPTPIVPEAAVLPTDTATSPPVTVEPTSTTRPTPLPTATAVSLPTSTSALPASSGADSTAQPDVTATATRRPVVTLTLTILTPQALPPPRP